MECYEDLEYLNFIEEVKRNPPKEDEISEIHHIRPRSLGGSNSPENLIKCSCLQHVKAHYFLALSLNPKMLKAFSLLMGDSALNLKDLSEEDLIKFGELREKAIKSHNQYMRENNPMADPKNRIKASQSLKKYNAEHPEAKIKIAEKIRQNFIDDPDKSKRLSEKNLQYLKEHPEMKEFHTQVLLNYRKEHPELSSEAGKASWASEETRLARTGENHPMKKEENRKKASKNTTALWKDENYKKAQAQAIKESWDKNIGAREKQSQITTAYYEAHPEARKAQSEVAKRLNFSDRKWYNNGVKNVRAFEQPEGFIPGRIKKKSL